MDTSTPNVAAAAPSASWRLRGILIVLLVNAVPIIGVLRFGWSAINVLVLYWFENVLVAVCTCVRLAVHRYLTRKRGYWREGQSGLQVNGQTVQMGLLGEYALMAFSFTFAHGIFVGVIALILAQNYPDQPMWQFSFAQVMRGVLVISAMLGIELVADLFSIRSRSFAWMKAYVQARVGRVIVLHLTIIFGMFAMAMTNSPLGILYVLIGLKTLSDLAGVAGSGATTDASSASPPAWALKTADRLAKDKGGAQGLLKDWQATQEQARRDAIADEEVMPAPR